MSLNERLIGVGAVACTTDTADVFGDGSGVALYTMDYDASDASGSYDGIPTNVEFGVGGQINYGAGFNGSSSYVSISATNTTPLDLSQENYSISAWVKFDTFSGDRAIISKWGSSASLRSILWWVSNGSIKFIEGGSADSIQSSTATLSSTGTWYHLVYIRSASESKIFINGSLDSTFARTQTIRQGGTEPYYLGSQSAGGFKNLDGSIDQVRIFNKALSSSEVSTLYAETACVYTCTTDTVDYPTTNVAYYKLDNSAEDETGIYDGTATNINYTFGRFGQAAVFNGSSSYIDTNYTLTSDTSVSFSFWLNVNDYASNDHYIFSDLSSSGTDRRLGIRITSSGYFAIDVSSNGTNIDSSIYSSAISKNQWIHYVVVLDGTSYNLYQDGSSVYTDTLTQTLSAGGRSLIMGRAGDYNPATNYYFDGKIDQVRFFSSALTSTQVTELYEEYECEDTSTFKPVLYTGNGSTQYISNVGFEPDFVWIKNRDYSGGISHFLADSVRGGQQRLASDSTTSEVNLIPYGDGITSFDSNGFTVADDPNGDNGINGQVGGTYGSSYVAWNWKAGGIAVTNTDGTITSQVSANTEAGFSIVKWTGNNLASQTIGHGLSSTPEITIIKKLTAALDWQVNLNSSITGTEGYLNLNLAVALYTTFPNYYTSANSTVLSTNGTTTAERQYNNQSADYIAYCFHSVAGYSKIGSYSGTGSAGNFVSTSVDGDAGFEPAFVMIKRSNGTGDWFIYDNKRASNLYLNPNLSNAEGTDGGIVFNSNGFTL
jgi:hypothetical protein